MFNGRKPRDTMLLSILVVPNILSNTRTKITEIPFLKIYIQEKIMQMSLYTIPVGIRGRTHVNRAIVSAE